MEYSSVAKTVDNQLDDGALDEFITETRDSFEVIDEILLQFTQGDLDDSFLLNLANRVHTFETVLKLGHHFNESNYAHRINILLNQIHEENLPFSEMMIDIVMVSIDYLRFLMEAVFAGCDIQKDAIQIKHDALEKLVGCLNEDLPDVTQETLEIFDPNSSSVNQKQTQTSITPDSTTLALVENENIKNDTDVDLDYFRHLMLQIEDCYPDWKGRGDVLLSLAAEMNKEAGEPIDSRQLEAAVYMHDFGMAFLPTSPLNKEGSLSDSERNKMQQHPLLGAELLYRVKGWDTAAVMVMQHHERFDGNGYPEGISDESIVLGAHILAIADTVYAMTNKSSYRSFKRPLLRAVSEINKQAGSQFSPYWVKIFNQVIRRTRGAVLKSVPITDF